jgi:ureidoacrylate peracid hydrolase
MNADAGELLSSLEQKASPAHAALVVVDVQNDFVADGGYFAHVGADMKTVQRAIPPLLNLIDRAREAGVLVIFVQAIYDPEFVSGPMRERNARAKRLMPRCLTGSWGAEFYAVRPQPDEPIVIKHRYTGMINTELPALLQRRGIRSLLMTGVSTDTCVESTARDAYFMDYYVTLVADCCAGATERDHRVALERFERDYGAVVTSADVIGAWETSGALAAPRIAAAG